jgi:hypothetical protein
LALALVDLFLSLDAPAWYVEIERVLADVFSCSLSPVVIMCVVKCFLALLLHEERVNAVMNRVYQWPNCYRSDFPLLKNQFDLSCKLKEN